MIELTIPTMTCGGCARAVTNLIRQVDPQARVDVDVPTKRVRVATTQQREALESALAEGGYPAG